jgi:hypothetical protein
MVGTYLNDVGCDGCDALEGSGIGDCASEGSKSDGGGLDVGDDCSQGILGLAGDG